MNLRTEKEQQRGALIKLRELSVADPNFSTSCQAEVDRLGLTVPTLSRLEMRTSTAVASARSRSVSRIGGIQDVSSAGSRYIYMGETLLGVHPIYYICYYFFQSLFLSPASVFQQLTASKYLIKWPCWSFSRLKRASHQPLGHGAR